MCFKFGHRSGQSSLSSGQFYEDHSIVIDDNRIILNRKLALVHIIVESLQDWPQAVFHLSLTEGGLKARHLNLRLMCLTTAEGNLV